MIECPGPFGLLFANNLTTGTALRKNRLGPHLRTPQASGVVPWVLHVPPSAATPLPRSKADFPPQAVRCALRGSLELARFSFIAHRRIFSQSSAKYPRFG